MKLFWSFFAILMAGMVAILPRANAATPTALPPMQLIIDRVRATSARENADYHIFNQHYSYQRDKITEFHDASGNLKSREEKLSTNTPNPALVIAITTPAVSSPQGGPAASQPSIHGVPLGKKEDLLNPDLLKRYTLTMVGRQMINGRPALIIDFKPASKDLPILNVKDRFLNCVAGRAWVDEQDFILEKVSLHLTQKVTVLGGVAGSVSRFYFGFDRDRTPDGYWYTSDLYWHLEAHEATYQRVVDHRENVTGLQKKM